MADPETIAADRPGSPGRLAWETWSAWIAERPSHLTGDDVPWEKLGASSRELCERIAAAVAAAERERLAVLIAERFKTVLVQPDNGYPVAAVPWSDLAGLLTSGLEARSEEGDRRG